MTRVEQRLADLERIVAQQRDQLDRQAEEIDAFKRAPRPTSHQSGADGSRDAEHSDRTRRMFFKTGLAAAGAAVAAPLVAQSASAANGDNLTIGQGNTASNATVLTSTGTTLLSDANVLTVSDQASSSSYPAAVGAYGQGDVVTNGLYAYTSSRDNTNSRTGHAVVARPTASGRSHIFLPGAGGDPRYDTYVHSRGELRSTFGELWFCVQSGTPGTWRRLAGPSSSGALHVISPRRAYDSRKTDGPLTSGFNRTVSVADSIDRTTGDVVAFNTVPTGATAVQFNLTIVRTVASGWLNAAEGGAEEAAASTINWFGPDMILANASMSTLNDERELTVFCGGPGASTHFIIDITGYTL